MTWEEGVIARGCSSTALALAFEDICLQQTNRRSVFLLSQHEFGLLGFRF